MKSYLKVREENTPVQTNTPQTFSDTAVIRTIVTITDSQEHKEDTQLQGKLHLVWSDALDQLK